jgi:hypothetical protein
MHRCIGVLPIVNIIHMPTIIRLIPYRVFPEPALPDTALTWADSAFGTGF